MDPVGSLVGWIVVYGAWGLFIVGLAERFVPVLPSHAMLLALGGIVAEGGLSLPIAFVSISLGGVLGCSACCLAVAALGNARATRLVQGTGWLFGVTAPEVEHRIAALRRNGSILGFSLQLLPTARFLAPVLAGLMGGRAWAFLVASSAGILVWNGLFLGAGYAASRTIGATNATVLAVTIILCLVATQAGLFWIVRKFQTRGGLETSPPRASG